jgi:hypothetical protein
MLALIAVISTLSVGQNYDFGARGPAVGPDRTNLAHVGGVNAGLEIRLQDEHRNARDKRVVVEARVSGVELVDPTSQGTAQYQGFLQYRLDGSAPMETTRLQHEFGNLSSGEHTIEVALVTRSRANITQPKNLTVHIP